MREIRGDFVQFDLLENPLPVIALPDEKYEIIIQAPIRLTIEDLAGLNDNYLRNILTGVFNIRIPPEIKNSQNYWETLAQIYGTGKLKWGCFDLDKTLPEEFYELNEVMQQTALKDVPSLERKLNAGYIKFNDPWRTRMERLSETARKAFVTSFFSKYAADACAYELKHGETRDRFGRDVFQKMDRYVPVN